MLGFFSRRSRPIRRTENYFSQIWNQTIQALSLQRLQRLYMYVYKPVYYRKKSFCGIKDKEIMLQPWENIKSHKVMIVMA